MGYSARVFIAAGVVLTSFPSAAANATPPCPGPSDWAVDGTPITSPEAVPTNLVVSPDPMGGAHILWSDDREPSSSPFLRYIDADGWAYFSEFPLSTGGTSVSAPRATPLADGSLLIAWADNRSDDGDIYVQRLSRGGGIWPSFIRGGIPVCLAAGRQAEPAVADDGQDGFYVAWLDRRLGLNADDDVFIQRFHEYGQVWEGWPANGIALSIRAGDQTNLRILKDGTGGALVFFGDHSKGLDTDLYLARIAADGTVPQGWENGKQIASTPGGQWGLAAASIPSGGAWLAWAEVTTFGTSPVSGVRAAKILGNGGPAPGWTHDGVAIGSGPGTTGPPTLAVDADGNARVGWIRSRSTLAEAVVMKVDASGLDTAWPAGGRVLGDVFDLGSGVALLPQGRDVIAAWSSPENGGDVRALRLDAAGSRVPPWPSDGAVVTSAPGAQRVPSLAGPEFPSGPIVADGFGGAIVFWFDHRGASAIYAQRILPDGLVAPGAFRPCGHHFRIIARAFPQPARSSLTVEAFVPFLRPVRFEIYDVHGRLRRVSRFADVAGPRFAPFQLDVADLRPGVYFVRYVAGDGPGPDQAPPGSTQRIVIAR